MEMEEEKVLQFSGLTLDSVKRSYTKFEMDSNPFHVRTFIIDDGSGQKPTLVMTHGALTSSIIFYRMLEPLSHKYRIVLFDNLGWGLNTRLQDCHAKESPEASEEWMRKWILKCINALDVPEKFFLFGNSMGAWLMCQYAS